MPNHWPSNCGTVRVALCTFVNLASSPNNWLHHKCVCKLFVLQQISLSKNSSFQNMEVLILRLFGIWRFHNVFPMLELATFGVKFTNSGNASHSSQLLAQGLGSIHVLVGLWGKAIHKERKYNLLLDWPLRNIIGPRSLTWAQAIH